MVAAWRKVKLRSERPTPVRWHPGRIHRDPAGAKSLEMGLLPGSLREIRKVTVHFVVSQGTRIVAVVLVMRKQWSLLGKALGLNAQFLANDIAVFSAMARQVVALRRDGHKAVDLVAFFVVITFEGARKAAPLISAPMRGGQRHKRRACGPHHRRNQPGGAFVHQLI